MVFTLMLAVASARRPPSGIASLAFTTRFTMTCSNCVPSTLTGHTAGSMTVVTQRFAHEAAQHLLDAAHDAVEVDHFLLEQLLPAEREELARQSSGAFCCGQNFADVLLAAAMVKHQLRVADDHGEQVVVNPAGQGTCLTTAKAASDGVGRGDWLRFTGEAVNVGVCPL